MHHISSGWPTLWRSRQKQWFHNSLSWRPETQQTDTQSVNATQRDQDHMWSRLGSTIVIKACDSREASAPSADLSISVLWIIFLSYTLNISNNESCSFRNDRTASPAHTNETARLRPHYQQLPERLQRGRESGKHERVKLHVEIENGTNVPLKVTELQLLNQLYFISRSHISSDNDCCSPHTEIIFNGSVSSASSHHTLRLRLWSYRMWLWVNVLR